MGYDGGALMIDEHAATELKLYIDNDGDLYRRQTTSILKNLATKKVRSQYKHDLAVKLFGYLVEAGAKKYAKEFGDVGTPWNKMFDVPTRKAVAEEMTRDFEGEFEAGGYDSLLPQKHRAEMVTGTKKFPGRVHATKKGAGKKWVLPEGLTVKWSPVAQIYFALWPSSAPLNKQQVLKRASAEEMHDWLRETYGAAYGLVGRTSHATKKSPAQLQREIDAALSPRSGRW